MEPLPMSLRVAFQEEPRAQAFPKPLFSCFADFHWPELSHAQTQCQRQEITQEPGYRGM